LVAWLALTALKSSISGPFCDSWQPWQTALRGSPEVFDFAHPAGQWVPSGENLGHHLRSREACAEA
jgi:hypothetical protein